MRKAFFFGSTGAFVAAFVACVGDDPVQSTPGADASTDTTAPTPDAAGDAAADAKEPCKIEAPFISTERVVEFSTSTGDYGLSFTADGLSAYVARDPKQAVYVHTRSSTSVPFGAAIPLSGMPAETNNYSPTISANGTELFFARLVLPSGETDIYRAEVGGGGAQNVGPAPGINHPDAGVQDDNPFIVNERILYFARRLDPSQGDRIFRAERATPNVPFSSVVAVNGLGTLPSEARPVVTPDELDIYFSAVEEDAGVSGFTRVMRASRVNAQMPFGAPIAVAGIQDVPGGRDAPLWLSADRCTLYFLSDRDKVGSNDPDIWVARRNP